MARLRRMTALRIDDRMTPGSLIISSSMRRSRKVTPSSTQENN
jgi:hypothetical protein